MTFQSRLFCCTRDRAAVADAFSVPTTVQKRKGASLACTKSVASSITEDDSVLETMERAFPRVADKSQTEDTSIFRESSSEERDDTLTLKRAHSLDASDEEKRDDVLTLKRTHPLDAADDEYDCDEYYRATPSKRQHRYVATDDEARKDAHESETMQLLWNDRIVEDESGCYRIAVTAGVIPTH